MKKTALLTSLLCLAQSTLHADVPLFINYQGKVADSTGLPIGASGTAVAPVAAPVNRKVIFRIYDASTGGNRLWTEEQTATISLGVFSVLLGNGINPTGTASTESRPALDTVFTPSNASSRFLEIMVDNGDNTITGSDVPISPRQQITSTAFALHAKVADGIASATDLTINPLTGTASNYGLGWYGTGRTFNSVAIDGPVLYGNSGGALGSNAGGTQKLALAWNAAGQVGVGATSSYDTNNKLTLQGDDSVTPARQLVIRGNADSAKRLNIGYNTTANQATLQSYTAASTVGNLLLNPSGGNVGIGTTNPAVALSVTGAITATGAITGGSFISNGGNIGIGTTAPIVRLQIDDGTTAGSYGSVQISRPNTGHTGSHLAFVRAGVTAMGLGYAPSSNVFGFGGGTSGAFSPGALSIDTNNGNVGIGTAAPGFPLNMSNANGDKIALWGNSGNTYGFGIQSNLLQIHTDTSAGDVAFGYGSSAAMTETMRIKGNGNVGIGTASPTQKLDVNGNAYVRGQINLNGSIVMGNGPAIWGTNNSGVAEQAFWPRSSNGTYINYGTSGFYIRNNASTNTMTMTDSGIVSIGTGTTAGRLNIGTILASYYRYGGVGTDGGSSSNSQRTNQPVSIWADGAIVTNLVDIHSDSRIKNILHPTDSAKDLQTLMAIQITDYQFKDTINNGNAPQKKVIAQQLEQSFPQAVSARKGVVPDIFKNAEIKNGWVQLATDLKVSERVRLVSPGGESVEEVLEVRGDAFRTSLKSTEEKTFVYGREVMDLRSVDYDAIAMLNVSATQEIKREKDAEIQALDRQLREKDAKIAALEAKVAAQDKRSTAQADEVTSQNARLVALEKLIIKSSASETVSIKLGEQ
jgi:hypothetical protein